MRSRYSLGETARLYLDVIAAGVGIVAQTPTIAIQRLSDGKWLQASDGTWQTTIVANAMTETDAANLPGRYHFDFSQALDAAIAFGPRLYISKALNVGAHPVLAYDDLAFGPMPGAAGLDRCSILGNIARVDGTPARAELVRATLQPVFKDALGRAVQSERVLEAYTNDTGDFDLSLVRGGVFRLEVPSIGYDRKVTVPSQSSALFTDL